MQKNIIRSAQKMLVCVVEICSMLQDVKSTTFCTRRYGQIARCCVRCNARLSSQFQVCPVVYSQLETLNFLERKILEEMTMNIVMRTMVLTMMLTTAFFTHNQLSGPGEPPPFPPVVAG